MVHFESVAAATCNCTYYTLANRFRLTDGPFGVQQLEAAFSFPGKTWAVWIQTSDVAAAIFVILIFTFALDHYLFESRYLVHIGGLRRAKDSAAILDEKDALHEKEARDIETGQKCSNDEDSEPESKSERQFNSPTSTNSRWGSKAFLTLSLLCLFWLIGDGKHASKTTTTATNVLNRSKAEAERRVDKSPPTSRWGKFVQHPLSQGIVMFAICFFSSMVIMLVLAFKLLFWPFLLVLFILEQCASYEALNPGVTVPWQSIALKFTLHLTIWTIIGATLLLRPNRLQTMLWRYLKWTHAVSWWLFWGILESFYAVPLVAGWIGFHNTRDPMRVVERLIMQPPLVAYLYCGTVCEVVLTVRLLKFFWKSSERMI